jgi:hypothetical protein
MEIDPELAMAWKNKGITLELLGRSNESDAAFARAKELGYAGCPLHRNYV